MKYKRYFYGGCLLVSLVFYKIALAEPLVINLYDSNGQGLDVDSVQINNILIDALVQNPFDPAVYEWKPLPFNFTFNACQSNLDDPNTLYLEPILTGEEPPCHMSSLDFSESQLVGQSHDWVQINNVRDTTQPQDNTVYYNITLELNLDKLRLEQRERLPIISSPSLAYDFSPIFAVPKHIIPKQVRIILSWEGNRRLDYDAHLTGPALGLPGSYYNEPDRFHIYFGNKNNEVSALYTDDFSHSQPEVIELFPPPGQETLRPGTYQYSVHHFQGTGNFVDAKVQVRLQVDQEPEQLFEPPLPPENEKHWNSTMQEWKVFQLIVDEGGILQIQPLQNITPSIPPAEVRRVKP